MSQTFKAFVSSTFEDLKDHRAFVIPELRAAGLFVDPMEDWTACADEPKKFCRDRIDGSDVCVLIVAYRRGFVPDGERRSITQLEYDYAKKKKIDVLVFLLDEQRVPWYAEFDERKSDPNIDEWRKELMKTHGVAFFNAAPTSIKIQAAISRWIAGRTGTPPLPSPPPPVKQIVGVNFQDVQHSFCGRVAELERLRKYLLHEKFVMVVGPHGAGKTALISKFCDELEDRLSSAEASNEKRVQGIVYFRCDAASAQVAERLYFDLIQLLPAAERQELKTLWTSPEHSDVAKFRALLAHFQQEDVLLVLDELDRLLNSGHAFADSSLRDFFGVCLTTPHRLRIMATSTDDLMLDGAARPYLKLLTLEVGFSGIEGAAFLRELDRDGLAGLRNADEVLLSGAVERCAGLPGALVSLFSILVDHPELSIEGLLEDTKLFDIHVGDGLIAQQYERQPPSRQRVLEILAVFGGPVEIPAVERLVARFFTTNKNDLKEKIDVADCLRHLVYSHCVVMHRGRKNTCELPSRLRRYVYERIPQTDETFSRQWAHSAAADFFRDSRRPVEQLQGLDDIQPQLSEYTHRVEAGEFDEAARVLNSIDEDYLQVWGYYAEVQARRERLLGKLKTPELVHANLGSLALVYRRRGRNQDAIKLLRQAVEVARSCSDRIALVNWSVELGNTLADEVDMAGAIEQYRAAIEMAQSHADLAGQVRALSNLGIAFRQLGQITDAIDSYSRAEQLARTQLASTTDAKTRSAAERQYSICRGNSGKSYLALGDYDEAAKRFQEGTRFALEIDYKYAAATFTMHLGEMFLMRRKFSDAIVEFENSLKILDACGGITRTLAYAFDLLGSTHAHLGERAKAIEALEKGVALQVPEIRYHSTILHGIMTAAAGDLGQACSDWQRGIVECDVLLTKSPHFYEAWYARALATLALDREEEARQNYEHALEVCGYDGVIESALLDLELLDVAISRPAIRAMMKTLRERLRLTAKRTDPVPQTP